MADFEPSGWIYMYVVNKTYVAFSAHFLQRNRENKFYNGSRCRYRFQKHSEKDSERNLLFVSRLGDHDYLKGGVI